MVCFSLPGGVFILCEHGLDTVFGISLSMMWELYQSNQLNQSSILLHVPKCENDYACLKFLVDD